MMEPEMFDSSRPTTSGSQIAAHEVIRINQRRSLYPKRLTKLEEYSTPFVLIGIAGQVVLGWFANSLAVMADAGRLFADHLENHHFDSTGTPGQRITDVILVGIACVALMVLSVVFVVNASTRAVGIIQDMNQSMLLAGTILSLTLNAFQVYLHNTNWNKQRSASLGQYAVNHRSQLLHGLLNHGLGIAIIAVPVFTFIYPEYTVVDSIVTYGMTALMITNVAAASRQCYREYCGLEYARDEYEEI